MLKKIWRITLRVIIGIFAFYVFVGAVVIPLVLYFGIKSQGTKILKTPVTVKSVWFNPLLLRISMYGLAVTDKDGALMLGFDRFEADASFLKFLQKKYYVEFVALDGLQVHAVMAQDGKINLLALVPPAPAADPVAAPAEVSAAEAAPAPAPLPDATVALITMKGGEVSFTDQMVQPNFKAGLQDMALRVENVSTDPAQQAKVDFSAKLGDEGVMVTETLLRPLAQPLELETNFKLNNYALTIATPYSGKYTGREIADGKLDVRMDYRISANKLTASHKILVQRFDFGKKVESKDALPLPFGLVVALLEDPSGKINIALPVTGDMSDPEFHYFHLIGQVARNFFMKLITKPFAFLASAIGAETGTEDLGYVNFIPGKAELSDEEKKKLDILVKSLAERPRIYLDINGSYDPEVDWKAIKTEVFEKDYTALRAESLRTESLVYQQLYQRRFGVRDLWALTKKYKLKAGGYKEEELNKEIKRQLIEEGSADKLALQALAQTRSQVIYDYFMAQGADPKRVNIAQLRTVQASMGKVPLEFSLTVFEDEEEAPQENILQEPPAPLPVEGSQPESAP